MPSNYEIYINLESDCDDAGDAVCIGFSFVCPICGKLAEEEPRGHKQSYYINLLYSWRVKSGTLIRCCHCNAKFKTITDCNMFGKTAVEVVEKHGATCYNAEKG